MNVKKEYKIFKILALMVLCAVSVSLVLTNLKSIEVPNSKLKEQQSHLVMRSIGHDLLNSLGNESEVIPPVQKIDSFTYRLKFNSPIIINPDTLVKISLKHINKNFSYKSIINVLNKETQTIAYAFEINHLKENNIPCLGRVLPKSDYLIDISFLNRPKEFLSGIVIFSVCVIILLCLVIMVSFLRGNNISLFKKVSKKVKIITDFNQIAFNDNIIQLTDKEMQIFSILFKEKGKLVTREYLTDEVWLKKGTVTTRSLDMYISRLRKKIGKISDSKIINYHGKGYVLEI